MRKLLLCILMMGLILMISVTFSLTAEDASAEMVTIQLGKQEETENLRDDDSPKMITIQLTQEWTKLSFLPLEELWGLDFQEIINLYPQYVVNGNFYIYNTNTPAPAAAFIRAKRIVPLGYTEHGDTMVLCESDGAGSPCSIGYIESLPNGKAVSIVHEHGYPACVSDQASGLPETFARVPAVVVYDVNQALYNRGYEWGAAHGFMMNASDVELKENDKVSYLTTITTSSGKYDYIHAPNGRYADDFYAMIPHGRIRIEIPLASCEIHQESDRYGFSGEVVYPEVEIFYRGQQLKEGEDYYIESESIEPGPAHAIIRGMGYFAGEARVDYTICRTTVALDEIKQIVVGEEALLTAIIWTTEDEETLAGIPSDETIRWELRGIYQSAEWTEQVIDHGEFDYLLTRRVKPENPGEYIISVTYDGITAKGRLIVEPELVYSAGPLLENGMLAEGKNRDWIDTYTDIRLSTEYDAKNMKFLHFFLKDTVSKLVSVNEYNTKICDMDYKVDTRTNQLSLVIRIKSILPENVSDSAKQRGWLQLITPAKQKVDEKLRVSTGRIVPLSYRAELTEEERKQTEEEAASAKTGRHMFYFDNSFFYWPASIYQNSLAVMSLGLEMSSFSTVDSDIFYSRIADPELRGRDILDAFDKLGFLETELIKYDQELTSIYDDVGFAFGTRYIASTDTDDTLVAVVIRGGGYGAEWASNFHVGKEGNHEGFSLAAREVERRLEDYILRLQREGKIIGNLKLWVTGFSRGGAVANLLGESLASRTSVQEVSISAGNTFVYTFATPAGHRGMIRKPSANIFNVISENDLVPKLAPAEWGFTRDGRDIILKTKTPAAVEKAFYAYRAEKLELNNVKWAEDAMLDTLVSLYPATTEFTKNAELLIRVTMQYEYKTAKGSFVTGFVDGLTYSLLADLGERVEKQSALDNLKLLFKMTKDIIGILKGEVIGDLAEGIVQRLIEKTTGFSFQDSLLDQALGEAGEEAITNRILNAAEELIASGIVNVLEQDDEKNNEGQGFVLLNIAHAHYPEHYLAWLETGGEAEISRADSFALMTNDERNKIENSVYQWIQ